MVLLVLMQFSCTSLNSSSKIEEVDTAGGRERMTKDQVWQLVAIQGRPLVPSSSPITLIFNPKTSSLHGQAQCNTYTADYSLHDSRLIISNLQPSNTQCPEALMNAEKRYLATLQKCTQLSLSTTTLSLGNKNKTLLQFELQ